jgi:hypothetical protein
MSKDHSAFIFSVEQSKQRRHPGRYVCIMYVRTAKNGSIFGGNQVEEEKQEDQN